MESTLKTSTTNELVISKGSMTPKEFWSKKEFWEPKQETIDVRPQMIPCWHGESCKQRDLGICKFAHDKFTDNIIDESTDKPIDNAIGELQTAKHMTKKCWHGSSCSMFKEGKCKFTHLIKNCRYGETCKMFKEGACKFTHPNKNCWHGQNCKMFKEGTCNFLH